MQKNQIFKIYGTDFLNNTITLLTEADLASMIPSRDSRIAIKPNLVSPSPASYGATTHPEIVEGIILYLKERGFWNLVIMEGSWVGDRTEDAFDVCGFTALSDQYDIPLIDLQKAESLTMDCAGMKLHICRPVFDADFLINVPVMKGHCQTRITCALKNMKGVIPNSEKRRFHSLGLHRPIAHLAAGVRQDFIVVDHICGDLDFEDGGNPVVRNGIFAAIDPVLIDSYICNILHYNKEEIPYIGLAQKLGAGSSDLSLAQIRVLPGRDESTVIPGKSSADDLHPEEVDSVTGSDDPTSGGKLLHEKDDGIAAETDYPIADPEPLILTDDEIPAGCAAGSRAESSDSCFLPHRKVVLVEDAVEEVESCSACYGTLIPVLSRLHDEGLLSLLQEKICIGQGFRGKTGNLGVGNCTCGFNFFVEGCPPTEDAIYEQLKTYIACHYQSYTDQ